MRVLIDEVEVEHHGYRLHDVEIEFKLPPTPARTTITLDDWIAAKAPLDLAPCSEAPYTLVDGCRWVQDWPMPAGMPAMRRDLCASTMMWCYSIARKLDEVGQVSA